MTSQCWIDLQKAVENKKEAIKEQTKLREQKRKLKREELEKKCMYLSIYLCFLILNQFSSIKNNYLPT